MAVVTLAEYTLALAVALAVRQYHNLVLAFHSNKHHHYRLAAILSVEVVVDKAVVLAVHQFHNPHYHRHRLSVCQDRAGARE